MIKDDKKYVWIKMDCAKLAHVFPWVFKNMDYLLENKFQGNDNVKDRNSKICKNYLIMLHLSIRHKLKENRSSVDVHREFMNK